MKRLSEVCFSVLDLCPIAKGSTAADAFANSRDLIRLAERLGYHRYWVAEHHNIPGVASSATSVVIAHLAAATSRIRVGSGGIMLPNHAPLVIAEHFGTLETLFPGRIDLGLGRAPGGDPLTARALRRNLGSSGDTFPQDVRELQGYFATPQGAAPRAIPGAGMDVPLYLLGSSTFSAELAARMGLPFAFASHFAPDALETALHIYRSRFEPSPVLGEPYVLVGVNVITAPTDDEARRIFTTVQQIFLNMIRGRPGQMPAPVDTMTGRWSAMEEAQVRAMTRISAVGGPATVRRELEVLVDHTAADELITTAMIFDPADRLRSCELLAAECFL